jgi:hypothetical protein
MSITTKSPGRAFSFTDHSTRRPAVPQPGDRLDREFDAIYAALQTLGSLTRAVHQTAQIAYEDLAPSTIQRLKDHLAPSIAEATRQISSLADVVNTRAHSILADQRTIQAQLRITTDRAARAETAARAAEQTSTEVNQLSVSLQDSASDADNSANDAAGSAAAAHNDEQLAGAWAEYMPTEIPAMYFAHTSITGQHWSSRWWANQAAAAFGSLASLYLGAHPAPPTNTATGGAIPIGAIYYNTTSGQPFVWNGTEWVPFYAPTKSLMLTLLYRATADQTAFPLNATDLNGQSYVINVNDPEPLDVYLNGARLPRDAPVNGVGDWDFDPATNTLTFLKPLYLNSSVQIDILSPASAIAPSRVQTQAIEDLPADGTTLTFPLYLVGHTPLTPTSAQELFISLDGVPQKPGTDYNVSSGAITFGEAPLSGSRAWGLWYGPGTSQSGGPAYLPILGGTMQGPLTLYAAPAQPMEAANKGYIDNQISTVNPTGRFLPLTGGTLTGPLTLTALPTSASGLPAGTVWSNGGVLCVA